MTQRFFILLFVLPAFSFPLTAFAKTDASAKKSSTSALSTKDMDSDPDQCVIDDGNNEDAPWTVFENAIPACKRAVVTLGPQVKLDIGKAPVMKNYDNGMNNIKVSVVSGKGSYDSDDTMTDLTGITLWISLDRCQLRNVSLRDENDHDVDELKKARYILTNQESVSGIANGDDLKGYQNDCEPAAAAPSAKKAAENKGP